MKIYKYWSQINLSNSTSLILATMHCYLFFNLGHSIRDIQVASDLPWGPGFCMYLHYRSQLISSKKCSPVLQILKSCVGRGVGGKGLLGLAWPNVQNDSKYYCFQYLGAKFKNHVLWQDWKKQSKTKQIQKQMHERLSYHKKVYHKKVISTFCALPQ